MPTFTEYIISNEVAVFLIIILMIITISFIIILSIYRIRKEGKLERVYNSHRACNDLIRHLKGDNE